MKFDDHTLILSTSPVGRMSYLQRSLPLTFFFFASTFIVLLTGNAFIIALWLLIWLLSAAPAISNKSGGFMTFFLGITFLYPAISLDYSDIHEKNFLLGVFFCCFFVFERKEILAACREFKSMKRIMAIWFGLGMLAYLHVLFASIVKYGLRERLPDYLEAIATQDTLLKTSIHMLTTVFIIALPIVSLKEPGDLRGFIKTVYVLTVIVMVGGVVGHLFKINLANEDYSVAYAASYRLHTFSMPDANGFGRLLLMPVILFVSLAFKKMRLTWLLLVAGALFCITWTYSRTTYVSFGVGLLMIVLGNFFRMRGVVMAAILSLILAAFVNYMELPELFSRDVRMSNTGNWQSRLYLQSIAGDIVESNPLFGAFPGGYQREMLAHGFPSSRRIVSPHNMFLGVAVEWGAPMAALMLVALIASIMNGFQSLRKLAKATLKEKETIKALAVFCIALPVAYLAHGISEIIPPEQVFFLAGVSYSILRFVKNSSAKTNGREPVALDSFNTVLEK